MRLMLAAAVCAAVLGGGAASAAEGAGAGGPAVAVSRHADGSWTADYRFDATAPAWVFARSAVTELEGRPWRPMAWTVETPGVRLERRGRYDVLAAVAGDVPARVRIRFTPFGDDVRADYEPALVFSEGSVALFTDQFDVVPAPSAAAAEVLPADVEPAPGGEARVTFADARGPLLFRGERLPVVEAAGAHGYVVFGPIGPVDSGTLPAIVDPGLPAWIGGELETFTPQLLGLYAERLGPRRGPTPTIMASWAGPEPEGLYSSGGSVLPGLVIMRFQGGGLLAPDPRIAAGVRWFLAHEAAHFWVGQTVAYERSADSWITEGAAELLAVRAVQAMDPAQGDERLQGLVDECVVELRKGPVGEAGDRGDVRAWYACGAVFHLAAEAGAGGDLFAFWRDLIAGAGEDGVITAEEWLGALEAGPAASIRRLLHATPDDPRAAVAGLLDAAGADPALRPAVARP